MASRQLLDEILPLLRHLPQRNVTSLNVEDDTKACFDYLHAFWELESGADISQPDAARILLVAAVDNPQLSVPPGLRERVRASFKPSVSR